MNYDEIMNDMERISLESEKALEILSEEIGYEMVEALFRPIYETSLYDHNTITIESFLRSIETLAGKFLLYRQPGHDLDGKPQRIEKWVLHNHNLT